MEQIKNAIQNGKTVLGIELGSTRIKAVLIDENNNPIASGSYEWENRLENGIWTYSLEDVWTGIQTSYKNMADDVKNQYGEELTKIGAIGFSAMMHGYMAFDENKELLVPFRTWRNSITGKAAAELTSLFDFNIPETEKNIFQKSSILQHLPDMFIGNLQVNLYSVSARRRVCSLLTVHQKIIIRV